MIRGRGFALENLYHVLGASTSLEDEYRYIHMYIIHNMYVCVYIYILYIFVYIHTPYHYVYTDI